jgi:hypothetical protein
MDYTRKSTKNNIYDGFGQDFGRVARSGKEDQPTTQSLGSQSQNTYLPLDPVQSAGPENVQRFDNNSDNTPMMYNNGFNQSGYNNQAQPGWNSQYAGNNPMNSGFYPSPQPTYDGGVQPQYGQNFGNQFHFQGGPGPVPPPPMVPGAPSPFGNMQPGLMGPSPMHQFRGSGPFGNQMQMQPFLNQHNPSESIAQDDSNLVPPGLETEKFCDYNSKIMSGPKISESKHSPTDLNSKSQIDQNIELKEGLVTFCCKDYGFMGPDVFFATK